MHKNNIWIKQALANIGCYQYQLAKVLGYSEIQFCKLLREDVSDEWLRKGLNMLY